VGLIALPVSVLNIVKQPVVQDFLAHSASVYISKNLGAEVRIGGLFIDYRLRVSLSDISVKDHNGASVLKARALKIRPRKIDLENHEIAIDQLFVEEADVSMIKYKGDARMSFLSLFGEPNQDSISGKPKSKPWTIACSNLKIFNTSFNYQDLNRPPKEQGINYSDLGLSHVNLNAESVLIHADTISADIRKLSADEKSGLKLKKFKANVTLCPSGIVADHLKIVTNNSELSMNLKFHFSGFNAFNNFLDDVIIETTIGKSSLDLFDVGYFAPSLFEMGNVFEISGSFNGPVSALTARNFKFEFGQSTKFEGDLEMNGLPDIYETFTNLKINKLQTCVADISSFKVGPVPIQIPEQFSLFTDISINGYFTGFFNNFVANASFNTALGSLITDVSLNQKPKTDSIFYSGTIKANNFDIGKMLAMEDYFGYLSFNTKIDGSGLSDATALVHLNGQIDSMDFKGEKFENIRIKGELADNKFNGFLNVKDEKIGLNFKGKVDFSDKIPVFNFYARFDKARLFDLKLAKRDSVMILSSVIAANFKGAELDQITGNVQIDSTFYQEGAHQYDMGHLDLSIGIDSVSQKLIVLNSDYVDAKIQGKLEFSNLADNMAHLAHKYFSFVETGPLANVKNDAAQEFSFLANFKGIDELTRLFLSSLDLNGAASISGNYSSVNDLLQLRARADTFRFNSIRFDNWYLDLKTPESEMIFDMGAESLVFKEADKYDSIPLGLDSLQLRARFANDSVKYRLSWNDLEKKNWTLGDINGYVYVADLTKIDAKIGNSKVLVNGTEWIIDRDNHLYIDPLFVKLIEFGIQSKNQDFFVDGMISANPSDTLKVYFDKWRLSNFDLLLASSGLDLDGRISGTMNMSNLYKAPNVIAQIGVADFFLNKTEMGDLKIDTHWDDATDELSAAVQILSPEDDSTKILMLRGTYSPMQKQNNYHFLLSMNNFNIRSVNPFLAGIFSEIKGFASGNLILSGPTAKPKLNGSIMLRRAGLKVDYLNVGYEFTNIVKITPGAFIFDGMILNDSLGNKATVDGKISHDYFKDFSLDIKIKPENLVGMNTHAGQNSVMYGSAFASGIISISGPFDDITMDIKAQTEMGTNIKIPISSSAEIYEREYIIFVNSADTVAEKEDYNIDLKGLTFNFELLATPDAEIQIFLPDGMGNLKADGTGNILLGINPQGDFKITGDYSINSGTFLFSLRNLVNRRFDILKGGKISWTGSPYDAEIDVKAVYHLKASLDGLGIEVDSTSSYSRRINVECIVELKNQLFDPEIHFSIHLPTLDDETSQTVYSVLDTTNEAQMNQQMISLLVLGSFSYQTQTFGQSGASLLSNQLSNWLSQISKDFDVGVNYRPGGELSEEELEVALSTQLFNNRVIIDGNFGVVGDDQSNKASNIVGDVNVEIKLTEDGRFRVKAFNRSNYNSVYDVSSYDDIAPYTQGVGVFYRKDFNSFGELFRKKNKKKMVDQPKLK
jgi:translocation-and-assembly-module (TAM) inner membrane subunit TamB-like protein